MNQIKRRATKMKTESKPNKKKKLNEIEFKNKQIEKQFFDFPSEL